MTESRTHFDASTGRRTARPQFGHARATSQQDRNLPLPQFESEPAGLVEWLRTPEARQYEGRWVLLNDEFEVIDDDHSPSNLLRRNRHVSTPLVVFVDPADTNLVV